MTSDILIEIEGIPTAWSGSGTTPPAGLPSWAADGQVVREGLAAVIPRPTTSVSPYTGEFELGGAATVALDLSDAIAHSVAPLVYLAAPMTALDLVVTVSSTVGLPVAGTIWIDRECIRYLGIAVPGSPGVLGPCVRGALGTTAKARTTTFPSGDPRGVYFEPPILLGRMASVWRYTPTVAELVYVGRVDAVGFGEGGYALDLLSISADLAGETIATGMGRRATLVGWVDHTMSVLQRSDVPPFGQSKNVYGLDFEIESSSSPMLATLPDAGYIRMGDEIVKWSRSELPALRLQVIALPAAILGVGDGIRVSDGRSLHVGDTIEFTDAATATVVRVQIVAMYRVAGTGVDIHHSGVGLAPAIGSYLTTPLRQRLLDITRGFSQTPIGEHRLVTDAISVAVVDGPVADTAIRLLVSGSGDGSVWDVFPAGVGAAIPSSMIDLASWTNVRAVGNALSRRWILDAPVSPRAILADLAHLTQSRIWCAADGTITAARKWPRYPGETTDATIGTDQAIAPPAWRIAADRIYSRWTWQIGGGEITVDFPDSREAYRGEEAPSPQTDGLILASSISYVRVLSTSFLRRFGRPCPTVTVDVSALDTPLHPGDLVELRLLAPNEAGGEGTTDTWEVIGYAPDDRDRATVTLLGLPPSGRHARIAPSGRVEAWDVAAQWIRLESSATSHFSPLAAVPAGFAGWISRGDGTEDGDWFHVDDTLRIWDVSTFGSGAVVSAPLVVAALGPAATALTFVGALPAWLAIGDLLRLDTYATVAASPPAPIRVGVFAALAVIAGAESSQWGA